MPNLRFLAQNMTPVRVTRADWEQLPFYPLDSNYPSPYGFARSLDPKGRAILVYRDDMASRELFRPIIVASTRDKQPPAMWFWDTPPKPRHVHVLGRRLNAPSASARSHHQSVP